MKMGGDGWRWVFSKGLLLLPLNLLKWLSFMIIFTDSPQVTPKVLWRFMDGLRNNAGDTAKKLIVLNQIFLIVFFKIQNIPKGVRSPGQKCVVVE